MITLKNQDLELAKLRLIKEDLNLVIVKNGKVIFKTKEPGIYGFLMVIEKLDSNLIASSVADKIVGVAAAMLCVYAGVSSVFALTISEEGIRVLEENNVPFVFEKKVPNILNRNISDICPLEKVAINSESLDEICAKLKNLTK